MMTRGRVNPIGSKSDARSYEVSLTGGRTEGHLAYVEYRRYPAIGGRMRLVCTHCAESIAQKCHHVQAVRGLLSKTRPALPTEESR